MLSLIASVLLLLGAVFVLVAAVGLYRLPGLYLKMHASTKAGTLGSGLVLIGGALKMGDLHAVTESLLLILFIASTNPISAHLIAKVANQKNETP